MNYPLLVKSTKAPHCLVICGDTESLECPSVCDRNFSPSRKKGKRAFLPTVITITKSDAFFPPSTNCVVVRSNSDCVNLGNFFGPLSCESENDSERRCTAAARPALLKQKLSF